MTTQPTTSYVASGAAALWSDSVAAYLFATQNATAEAIVDDEMRYQDTQLSSADYLTSVRRMARWMEIALWVGEYVTYQVNLDVCTNCEACRGVGCFLVGRTEESAYDVDCEACEGRGFFTAAAPCKDGY